MAGPARPVTLDPTARFTERVADYAAHRPSYPPEVIGAAGARGRAAARRRRGRRRVRHRDPDRAAARSRPYRPRGRAERGDGGRSARRGSAANPRFHAVSGRAEATGLPDASCDVGHRAQAFHWFDVDTTRREFRRILEPGGAVVLVWNIRRPDTTPFLREYEALLQRFAPDYKKISAGWADEQAIARFFAPSTFEVRALEYRQAFGFDGLRGRLLSSSYAPACGSPAARADARRAAAALRPAPAGGRGRVRVRHPALLGAARVIGSGGWTSEGVQPRQAWVERGHGSDHRLLVADLEIR